jgi:hypothetical protein
VTEQAAQLPAVEDAQVKLGEKPQDREARRKEAIERARHHLSRTAGIDPREISLESATEETWPDTSLGCPEKDRMYAQVVTEGYKVVLKTGGTTHELHVARGRVVECKNREPRSHPLFGGTR